MVVVMVMGKARRIFGARAISANSSRRRYRYAACHLFRGSKHSLSSTAHISSAMTSNPTLCEFKKKTPR